jgi:hypothetical protein
MSIEISQSEPLFPAHMGELEDNAREIVAVGKPAEFTSQRAQILAILFLRRTEPVGLRPATAADCRRNAGPRFRKQSVLLHLSIA